MGNIPSSKLLDNYGPGGSHPLLDIYKSTFIIVSWHLAGWGLMSYMFNVYRGVNATLDNNVTMGLGHGANGLW